MISEQPGPPTDEERKRVGMEFLRVSQLRFVEGYKARMAEPHPMKKNAKDKTLGQREPKWSYKALAGEKCPQGLPSHERERWTAGFLHADGIAAERGAFAMERADPSKPPPRPKKVALAVQEDGFAEMAPALTRSEAQQWWDRHRGKSKGYQDAGEQK